MVVLSIAKNLFLAHCGASAPRSPALKFPTPPQSQLAMDENDLFGEASMDVRVDWSAPHRYAGAAVLKPAVGL